MIKMFLFTSGAAYIAYQLSEPAASVLIEFIKTLGILATLIVTGYVARKATILEKKVIQVEEIVNSKNTILINEIEATKKEIARLNASIASGDATIQTPITREVATVPVVTQDKDSGHVSVISPPPVGG